ncbi:melatonin receptor type 1A-like [Mytilus galloprovincialis]|uniref:G-protein coupled receptors family 1 profile domain-containing protein n=3 Tax=Mytilus TaxID=6548 RepID=A0A8B6CRJ0_MYTGA|nr:Hypothetical predicted protein [Mytilus galloprovincialis]
MSTMAAISLNSRPEGLPSYFTNDSVGYAVNTTNMTNLENRGPSDTALYIGGIIMLIALLCGLFGNFLVMIVCFTKRDLSNIINIFIISLCINDIINLGFNNSLVLLSYFLGTFPADMLVCELLQHLTVLLMGSSLWHTGLIAIHRLIVVVFNTFYKKISKKAYTIFVLIFARVVPLLFIMQPSLGSMAYYEPKLIRCVVKKDFGPFTLLVSVFLMMLPSVILILCYIAIFIKVHQSSKSFRGSRQRDWLKREIKITKMFGMIFLLILVGYLPYGITRAIDKKLQWNGDFYVAITVFFAVANSSNPIVYGIMDKQIRSACFQILGLRPVDVNKNGGPITMHSKISHADTCVDTEDLPLNSSPGKAV